jgi:hypothetical protein
LVLDRATPNNIDSFDLIYIDEQEREFLPVAARLRSHLADTMTMAIFAACIRKYGSSNNGSDVKALSGAEDSSSLPGIPGRDAS